MLKQQKPQNKLWDLSYRGTRHVTAAPYPVCVGKKNEMLASGNFLKEHFAITEHKPLKP